MVAFVFVGITAVYCNFDGLIFGFLVVGFCLLGRAAAVVPLAGISNLIKNLAHRSLPKEQRMLLSWQHVFMLFHAGLRGGIALVLTLELGSWVDEVEGPKTKKTLRNATVVVIVFFLVIFAGSTEFFLKLLKVPIKGEAGQLSHHHGRAWRLFYQLRENVLNPILVGDISPEEQFQDGPFATALGDIHHREQHAVGGTFSDASLQSNVSARDAMIDLFGTRDPGFLGGIEETYESEAPQMDETSDGEEDGYDDEQHG
eukprot:TRINITY_DN32289_c0_g1_i2.p1 TRINITY_DN32289_c0_g1~~TRINITY_DN32289_c0_g1_i2.p1  ORF type:complete len:273 (-),score=53.45 TRINITY_DN32289_c0_g1_i2:155-925(-)